MRQDPHRLNQLFTIAAIHATSEINYYCVELQSFLDNCSVDDCATVVSTQRLEELLQKFINNKEGAGFHLIPKKINLPDVVEEYGAENIRVLFASIKKLELFLAPITIYIAIIFGTLCFAIW